MNNGQRSGSARGAAAGPLTLAGTHAVVIGGTAGIGLATARALLGNGARVTCCSRTAEARTELDDLGAGVTRRNVDVGDEQSVRSLFQNVGAVDHLVITAAAVPSGRLDRSRLDDLRPAVETRLFGALTAIQCAINCMPATGSVVLFSGMAAHRGFPGESMAAAACGAVEGAVKTLAVELAPIRVNAVRPGNLWTATFRGFHGDHAAAVRDGLAATLPLGRLSEPWEIAHGVVFLLENPSVTGSVLSIDGGFAAI